MNILIADSNALRPGQDLLNPDILGFRFGLQPIQFADIVVYRPYPTRNIVMKDRYQDAHSPVPPYVLNDVELLVKLADDLAREGGEALAEQMIEAENDLWLSDMTDE